MFLFSGSERSDSPSLNIPVTGEGKKVPREIVSHRARFVSTSEGTLSHFFLFGKGRPHADPKRPSMALA